MAEHTPAALNHRGVTRNLLKAVEEPGLLSDRDDGLSEGAKG